LSDGHFKLVPPNAVLPPLSTLSDWHTRGLRQFQAALANCERSLAGRHAAGQRVPLGSRRSYKRAAGYPGWFGLGGQGTVLGPILGAVAYQRMRVYLLTSPVFKDIQLAVAGMLLLLIVLFVPAGLMGWLRHRYPGVRRVFQ
jgi:hypothetical protein